MASLVLPTLAITKANKTVNLRATVVLRLTPFELWLMRTCDPTGLFSLVCYVKSLDDAELGPGLPPLLINLGRFSAPRQGNTDSDPFVWDFATREGDRLNEDFGARDEIFCQFYLTNDFAGTEIHDIKSQVVSGYF